MPIAKEILNMLDVDQNPLQSISRPSLALNRKGKVFPLCDASFRSSNYADQQGFIALWVHPFRIVVKSSMVVHVDLEKTRWSSHTDKTIEP